MSAHILHPEASCAVVVPRAVVDNATSLLGILVHGAVSPTALCGYKEALARRLGVRIAGIAAIVHRAEASPGHAKLPQEDRAKVASGQGANVLDEPPVSLTVSLVLSIVGSNETAVRVAARLDEEVFLHRFGGGTVLEIGSVPGVIRGHTGCCLGFGSSPEQARALRRCLMRLSDGFVLKDRSDLFVPADGDARDALDVMLDAITAPAVKFDEKTGKPVAWKRRQDGWIVPVPIGFKAATVVEPRAGMRHGQGVEGHAYVQDVTGLAEWVSVRRAIAGNMDGCWWEYAHGGPEHLFLVRGASMPVEADEDVPEEIRIGATCEDAVADDPFSV